MNSKNIVRDGDLNSGHGGYSPSQSIASSKKTFINSKKVTLLGDAWQTHCLGDDCHQGHTTEGSETVFIEGKPVVRVGDKTITTTCYMVAVTGSHNTYAGG